jgi:cytochrome oxidase Cu insertion factor (SCO1/SenC/PrrC family)
VKPVFISVDPRRDTVGQMKNYGQDFHPSIAYLTGTREQVAVAAKAYRVYFSKVCAKHTSTTLWQFLDVIVPIAVMLRDGRGLPVAVSSQLLHCRLICTVNLLFPATG